MKKWLCAAATAGFCALSMTGVFADNLVLPQGEVLPLTDKVTVWNGQSSFLGTYVSEFLESDNLVKTLEKEFTKAGIFNEKHKQNAEELAKLTASLLKNSRMYQVRSEVNNTFYTGFVVSMPVSDKDKAALERLTDESVLSEKVVQDSKKPVQDILGEALGRALNKENQAVSVSDVSKVREGKSQKGIDYKEVHAHVLINQSGLLLPVYAGGFSIENKEGTTYNLILTDETAGNYFEPILQEALRRASR